MTDIRPTSEWKESPFQFGLFPGSLSSNKKRDMAPVLVVEIEHKHVSLMETIISPHVIYPIWFLCCIRINSQIL